MLHLLLFFHSHVTVTHCVHIMYTHDGTYMCVCVSVHALYVHSHLRLCESTRAFAPHACMFQPDFFYLPAANAEAQPCLPCDPDTTCLLPWLQGQSRFSGLTPGITFPGLNNQACAPVAVKWTKLHPNS